MSGIRSPLMINGVPVVAAPAEINLTTAEQLRTVLLHSSGHGHATIVVDMAVLSPRPRTGRAGVP